MSRQDDYDDRGPERPRRDDRNDYDDRNRERDYDRGPERIGGAGPSPLLLTASIITIAVGGVVLALGITILINGFKIMDEVSRMEQVEQFIDRFGGIRIGPPLFRGASVGTHKFVGIMQIINGFLGIAVGGVAIPAGIGMLVRKRWGRTMGLIVSFAGAGLVLLEFVRLVGGLFSVASGLHITFCFLIILLLAGMAVVNLITLFNGRITRTLR